MVKRYNNKEFRISDYMDNNDDDDVSNSDMTTGAQSPDMHTDDSFDSTPIVYAKPVSHIGTDSLSASSIGSSKTINGIRRPSDNLLNKLLLQTTADTPIPSTTTTSSAAERETPSKYNRIIDNTGTDGGNSLTINNSLSMLDIGDSSNNASTDSTRTSTGTSVNMKKYNISSLSDSPNSNESIVTNNTSVTSDVANSRGITAQKLSSSIRNQTDTAHYDTEVETMQKQKYMNKVFFNNNSNSSVNSTDEDEENNAKSVTGNSSDEAGSYNMEDQSEFASQNIVKPVPMEQQQRSDSTPNYMSNISADSVSTLKGSASPEVQRYMFQNGTSTNISTTAGKGFPSKGKQAFNSTNTNAYNTGAISNGVSNNSINGASTVIQSNKQFSSSDTAVMNQYKLTPSQRLRMRREQNKNQVKNSIKFKEHLYDRIENREKMYDQHGQALNTQGASQQPQQKTQPHLTQGANASDLMVWNVPVALNSSSFYQSTMGPSKKSNTYLKKDSSAFKRANSTPTFPTSFSSHSDLFMDDMPASPIPGVTSRGEMNSLYDMTTKNLSKMYLNSSKSFSQTQLQTRMDSMESLPQMAKVAEAEGLEDLKLISDEKLKNITSSRPMWLPNKPQSEIKKHNLEICKTLSNASIDKLNLNKKFNELPSKIKEQREKFEDIVDSVLQLSDAKDSLTTINRNSLLLKLQSIVIESPNIILSSKRLSTYKKLTHFNIYGQNFKSQIYNEFDDIYTNKFLTTEFNQTKNLEVVILIKLNLVQYAQVQDDSEIPEDLIKLCKMKMLTSDGLQTSDIVIFQLLLNQYGKDSLETVWEINEILSIVCFNQSVQKKFDEKILMKFGVVYKYLKGESSFDNEFTESNLNFDNLFHVINKLPSNLVFWVLDVILVSNLQVFKNHDLDYYHKKLNTKLAEIKLTNPSMSVKTSSNDRYESMLFQYWSKKYMVNNYKILESFVLSVLLNYHFGYNDFQELKSLNPKTYNILGLSSMNVETSNNFRSNHSSMHSYTSQRRSVGLGSSTSSVNVSEVGNSLDKEMGFEYMDDEYVLLEGFITKWMYYYKKF